MSERIVMRIDNIHSNIRFQAIYVRDKQVMDIIKSRARTRDEFNKFKNLVIEQSKNKFNIRIGSINHGSKQYLNAYIYDGHSFFRDYKESYLSTFMSPINFISKVCADANALFKVK